ncbi:hypothetical protein [Frankia sp. CcWB3]
MMLSITYLLLHYVPYEAANNEVLSRADRMFAVWDGRKSSKAGGTAATVELAKARHLPIVVI